MPKIGRQLRQQLLDVCAGPIPSDHPMNGCGVSNVVDARLVLGGGFSPNLSGLSKPTK
jgi:hypothetical protein